jgi:pseudouridine-5'-phosphate glycosidase
MLLYEKYTDISESIVQKLRYGKAVVGIDSMIFKEHWSLEKKSELIDNLREKIEEADGALGMIAIIKGIVKVGLTKKDIEFLGTCETLDVIKRKDIPYYISKKLSGVVTFDAALLLGNLVGIRIFTTDYIGCEESDRNRREYIYRELQEVAKKNIIIIASGVKNYVELGIMKKCLEEYSIPMIGYQLDDVPLGVKSAEKEGPDYRFNTPLEIVEFIKVKWEFGINGGVIILNNFQNKSKKFERVIYNASLGTLLGNSLQNI